MSVHATAALDAPSSLTLRRFVCNDHIPWCNPDSRPALATSVSHFLSLNDPSKRIFIKRDTNPPVKFLTIYTAKRHQVQTQRGGAPFGWPYAHPASAGFLLTLGPNNFPLLFEHVPRDILVLDCAATAAADIFHLLTRLGLSVTEYFAFQGIKQALIPPSIHIWAADTGMRITSNWLEATLSAPHAIIETIFAIGQAGAGDGDAPAISSVMFYTHYTK
ncbi:hypothetical protein BDV93DRAFT_506633 [Ceratobasidium sp. AG-I]|nr:hypothetical protein BDV93DRAFT_506633 [Ceratobasidium sp. AG-I]